MTAATDGATGDFRARRQPVLATVAEVLPNALFRLRLEDGSERLAHVGGNLRMGSTRLLPGDLVQVELSPFDPTKARISARAGSRGR